jgi:hypothetical protein
MLEKTSVFITKKKIIKKHKPVNSIYIMCDIMQNQIKFLVYPTKEIKI